MPKREVALSFTDRTSYSARAHSSQPLQEGGMGVVEKDIGPVRGKIAKVAHGKLFQDRSQGRSIILTGSGKLCQLSNTLQVFRKGHCIFCPGKCQAAMVHGSVPHLGISD